MANTTGVFWSANGESLQTYARNISSLEGKLAMPSLRGSDVVIPHRRGQVWVPKVADSRILPLAMWVSDSNADGVKASTKAERMANFDTNWRALMNLLWREGERITLTKRFTYMGDTRIAHAKAEFTGGIAPSMVGRYAARAVITLNLTDPYFYDDYQDTYTLANGDNNVVVIGDVTTHELEIDIAGARNKPILNNKSLGITLQYNGILDAGDSAKITVPEFKTWTIDAGNPLGYISNARAIRTGSPMLFGLKPGANTVNLSSTSGNGLVTIKSRAAWL